MQKENQLKSCYKIMLSSREVVARDLPHPMPLFNEKKQSCFTEEVEDPRTLRAAKLSGMTTYFYNDYRGFTLIELLVVVLIIGILTAVALPQYQRAVIKSHYSGIKLMTESLFQTEELYKLANGEYTSDLESLDIHVPLTAIPSSGWPKYEFENGFCFTTLGMGIGIYCLDPFGSHIGYMVDIFDYRGTKRIRKFCCVTGASGTDAPTQTKFCKDETGSRANASYGDSGGGAGDLGIYWSCYKYQE